jgi:hypothetical protein
VLVYDGDCGFCTSAAEWVGGERAAWQQLGPDGLARLGLTVEDARDAAWWVDETSRYRGHLAIGHALAARSPLGRALLVPPLRWLAAGAYPLVVRLRHRLPACRA